MLKSDTYIIAAMIGTFALWLVLHISLVWSLLWRTPTPASPGGQSFLRRSAMAALALVVVPLAPVLGFVRRARIRSVLWLIAALSYAVLRVRFG